LPTTRDNFDTAILPLKNLLAHIHTRTRTTHIVASMLLQSRYIQNRVSIVSASSAITPTATSTTLMQSTGILSLADLIS